MLKYIIILLIMVATNSQAAISKIVTVSGEVTEVNAHYALLKQEIGEEKKAGWVWIPRDALPPKTRAGKVDVRVDLVKLYELNRKLASDKKAEKKAKQ